MTCFVYVFLQSVAEFKILNGHLNVLENYEIDGGEARKQSRRRLDERMICLNKYFQNPWLYKLEY